MQTASIEFLQQFREETIRLPRSQRSLFFRPFPGIKKEKILLDRLVEERLTRTSLLRELIVKLIQQDQAVGRRTSEHAKKILATFSAIVRMDPSSAQYLIRLSKEIRQLLDWIVSYQGQTETTLLNRLKCIASKKNCHHEIRFFCLKDIDNTEMAIQLFSDGLCRYYEILCHYFEFEAESGGRTMVVSDTGRRLYCLLVLMGKHIDAIATTAALLKEWKVQIRNIEIQEIYN